MRSEAQFLFDILDASDAIAAFIRGKTLEEFASDDLLRSAVLMKLFVVGEAVAQVSEQTRDRYPEIPWDAIRGFRNFVAHQYFHLRWDIVWNSATIRVPELATKVEEILRNEHPGAEPEYT
jgi:uncharacterized protein with HEPN domain